MLSDGLAINVENMDVKYDQQLILENISFNIKYGEIFGLLGPNGAGKTTTLKVLATLKKPAKGTVKILGRNISKDLKIIRANIALLSQQNALDIFLNVYDNLYFFGWLQLIPATERRKRVLELLDIFGLMEKKDALVQTLSGGLYRRVQLARIFLSDAKIFFLDEPSLAFDAEAKKKFWVFLKEIQKSSGITIVLATNDLIEAEQMCDRIAFIKDGHIVACDSPERLKKMMDKIFLSIQFEEGTINQERIMAELINSKLQTSDGLNMDIELNSNGHLHNLSKIIQTVEQNGNITSINVRKPDLTDVFMKLSRGE